RVVKAPSRLLKIFFQPMFCRWTKALRVSLMDHSAVTTTFWRQVPVMDADTSTSVCVLMPGGVSTGPISTAACAVSVATISLVSGNGSVSPGAVPMPELELDDEPGPASRSGRPGIWVSVMFLRVAIVCLLPDVDLLNRTAVLEQAHLTRAGLGRRQLREHRGVGGHRRT